jgi:hypothetical protein
MSQFKSRYEAFDAANVVNEAQFSKFVHKETHTRPGRADHFRKCLLADFRDYRRRSAFLAEVRQQQKQTGKTFLARIKQLIDSTGDPSSGNRSTMNSAILSFNEVKFWHLSLDSMDFTWVSVQPCTSAASISLRL